MLAIALFVPKSYFTPVMPPERKKVFEFCNSMLSSLRNWQPYAYSPHLRGDIAKKLRSNSPHPFWELKYLKIYLLLDDTSFNDAISVLQRDDYIVIDGELISTNSKGRAFYATQDGYDIGQNDPLPEMEYVENEHGLLVPKKTQEPEVRFEQLLDGKDSAVLIKYLTDNKLVNNPKKFIEFLNGLNDGSEVEITPDDKDNNLTAVCILLKQLRIKSRIQLTAGKDFVQYFTSHIRPLSTLNEKEQHEKYKSAVRKLTDNKTWKESSMGKDLQKAIDVLKAMGIVVFVIYQ